MFVDKTPKIRIDSSEVDGLLLDVLNQACGIEDDRIDNSCMAAYEDACDYLVEQGYLQTTNTRIYTLTKKAVELMRK